MHSIDKGRDLSLLQTPLLKKGYVDVSCMYQAHSWLIVLLECLSPKRLP